MIYAAFLVWGFFCYCIGVHVGVDNRGYAWFPKVPPK